MKFKKIGEEAYVDTCRSLGTEAPDEQLREEWQSIPLPIRTSYGSAGYDFTMPYDVELKAGESVIICTGIAFESERKDVCLMILPRSSVGIKYGLKFLNTIPLIDVDNVQGFRDNQILLYTTVDKDCALRKGQKFAQAVILPYFTTDDDRVVIKEDKSLFKEQGFEPWKR